MQLCSQQIDPDSGLSAGFDYAVANAAKLFKSMIERRCVNPVSLIGNDQRAQPAVLSRGEPPVEAPQVRVGLGAGKYDYELIEIGYESLLAPSKCGTGKVTLAWKHLGNDARGRPDRDEAHAVAHRDDVDVDKTLCLHHVARSAAARTVSQVLTKSAAQTAGDALSAVEFIGVGVYNILARVDSQYQPFSDVR